MGLNDGGKKKITIDTTETISPRPSFGKSLFYLFTPKHAKQDKRNKHFNNTSSLPKTRRRSISIHNKPPLQTAPQVGVIKKAIKIFQSTAKDIISAKDEIQSFFEQLNRSQKQQTISNEILQQQLYTYLFQSPYSQKTIQDIIENVKVEYEAFFDNFSTTTSIDNLYTQLQQLEKSKSNEQAYSKAEQKIKNQFNTDQNEFLDLIFKCIKAYIENSKNNEIQKKTFLYDLVNKTINAEKESLNTFTISNLSSRCFIVCNTQNNLLNIIIQLLENTLQPLNTAHFEEKDKQSLFGNLEQYKQRLNLNSLRETFEEIHSVLDSSLTPKKDSRVTTAEFSIFADRIKCPDNSEDQFIKDCIDRSLNSRGQPQKSDDNQNSHPEKYLVQNQLFFIEPSPNGNWKNVLKEIISNNFYTFTKHEKDALLSLYIQIMQQQGLDGILQDLLEKCVTIKNLGYNFHDKIHNCYIDNNNHIVFSLQATIRTFTNMTPGEEHIYVLDKKHRPIFTIKIEIGYDKLLLMKEQQYGSLIIPLFITYQLPTCAKQIRSNLDFYRKEKTRIEEALEAQPIHENKILNKTYQESLNELKKLFNAACCYENFAFKLAKFIAPALSTILYQDQLTNEADSNLNKKLKKTLKLERYNKNLKNFNKLYQKPLQENKFPNNTLQKGKSYTHLIRQRPDSNSRKQPSISIQKKPLFQRSDTSASLSTKNKPQTSTIDFCLTNNKQDSILKIAQQLCASLTDMGYKLILSLDSSQNKINITTIQANFYQHLLLKEKINYTLSIPKNLQPSISFINKGESSAGTEKSPKISIQCIIKFSHHNDTKNDIDLIRALNYIESHFQHVAKNLQSSQDEQPFLLPPFYITPPLLSEKKNLSETNNKKNSENFFKENNNYYNDGSQSSNNSTKASITN